MMPGVASNACNLSTLEAEAEGLLKVEGQPELQETKMGWGDDSVVKGTACFSRGHGFDS